MFIAASFEKVNKLRREIERRRKVIAFKLLSVNYNRLVSLVTEYDCDGNNVVSPSPESARDRGQAVCRASFDQNTALLLHLVTLGIDRQTHCRGRR